MASVSQSHTDDANIIHLRLFVQKLTNSDKEQFALIKKPHFFMKIHLSGVPKNICVPQKKYTKFVCLVLVVLYPNMKIFLE